MFPPAPPVAVCVKVTFAAPVRAILVVAKPPIPAVPPLACPPLPPVAFKVPVVFPPLRRLYVSVEVALPPIPAGTAPAPGATCAAGRRLRERDDAGRRCRHGVVQEDAAASSCLSAEIPGAPSAASRAGGGIRRTVNGD